MTPLVSVIVPNYNHAPFLKERMDSVLRQDYPNYEVIVLDDCSTDHSMSLLQTYATDPHVRVIQRNQHNSGNTFVQWRKGFEMAQGTYIWIAESDDVADAHLLTTLIEPMTADEQVVLSFGQSKWIDEHGKQLHSTVYRRWTHEFIMDGEEFIRRYLLGYNFICNASAVLMRRDAALRVSRACEQYKASGDRQVWIEIAAQGKVHYTPYVCNAFRQHAHKVSGPAAQKGLNTLEDYAIYTQYIAQHTLSRLDKIRICCYHLRASLAGEVEQQARRHVIATWRKTWRQ